MRLPRKKKPGDRILAADWNALIDALLARTPQKGTGMSLVSTPSGFYYRAEPKFGDGPSPRPFQGSVKNPTTITIAPGYVWGFDGAGPAVSTHVEVEETDVTVSSSGSIWLEIDASFTDDPTKRTTKTITHPGDPDDTTEDIDVASSRAFPADASPVYTTSEPSAGSAGWSGSTGTFYIKILDFTVAGGVVTITRQYIDTHIEINEVIATVS